jgi:alanine racemase
VRYQSSLEVNLTSFNHNISKLKARLSNQKIIFMVKANGYGHGMDMMARQAYQSGISEFGVASLAEAVLLRENDQLNQASIYVFSENCLEDTQYHQVYVDNRIIPVVHSFKSTRIFFYKQIYLKHLPLCIKIDTGMNRFWYLLFRN